MIQLAMGMVSRDCTAMASSLSEHPSQTSKKMGFWKCWAMSVGVMIGSGVFMLPAVLAPYGSASFLGWIFTAAGAIVIALILGRLASQTERPGGTYVYTQEAFGNLAGFLIAWGYWLGIVFASAAISTAFAGYLGAFIPALGESKWAEGATAALLIWTLTAVNIRSVSAGATFQLVTTMLKLLPLVVIVVWGLLAGSPDNIPPFNPTEQSMPTILAATALLTMWAFVGLEASLVAADDVENPKRTIPRAIVAGTVTVASVYIAVTFAVMLLVPADILAVSKAPFVDAAAGLGTLGAALIAVGALVSTAGAANGNLLLGGQMPMAVALDGLAPKFLARRNAGNAPVISLIVSGVLSTILLIFNYTDGLLAAFTFLIAMSTLCTLLPYFAAAFAEIKRSWRSARGWVILAILALIYSGIAMLGSGVKILMWGALLMLAGLPVYYFGRTKHE